MTETDRELQLRRYRAVIDFLVKATGMSRSALARAAEISPSTLNRPYRDDDAALPKWSTVHRVIMAADPTGALLVDLERNAPVMYDEDRGGFDNPEQGQPSMDPHEQYAVAVLSTRSPERIMQLVDIALQRQGQPERLLLNPPKAEVTS